MTKEENINLDKIQGLAYCIACRRAEIKKLPKEARLKADPIKTNYEELLMEAIEKEYAKYGYDPGDYWTPPNSWLENEDELECKFEEAIAEGEEILQDYGMPDWEEEDEEA